MEQVCICHVSHTNWRVHRGFRFLEKRDAPKRLCGFSKLREQELESDGWQ